MWSSRPGKLPHWSARLLPRCGPVWPPRHPTCLTEAALASLSLVVQLVWVALVITRRIRFMAFVAHGAWIMLWRVFSVPCVCVCLRAQCVQYWRVLSAHHDTFPEHCLEVVASNTTMNFNCLPPVFQCRHRVRLQRPRSVGLRLIFDPVIVPTRSCYSLRWKLTWGGLRRP